MINQGYKLLEIDDAGVNHSLSVTEYWNRYRVEIASGDSGTLSGDVTINAAATGNKGDTYVIEFADAFDLDGNNFTVFGVALTDALAANKPTITAVSDGSSAYTVFIQGNSAGTFVVNANIANGTIELEKLADFARGSVFVGSSEGRPSALDASADGRIMIGDGNDVVVVSVSGAITIDKTGATTLANAIVTLANMANLATGTIIIGDGTNRPVALNVSGSGKIPIGNGTTLVMQSISGDGTITSGGVFTIVNGAVTFAKMATATKEDYIHVPVSFETGRLGAYKAVMPACTVVSAYSNPTDTIEGSNDATITLGKDGVGSMSGGVITHDAGDTIGDDPKTCTPTTNNTFAKGDILTLTTAKSTAGGAAFVSVEILRG